MKFGAPLLGAFAVRDPIVLKDYVQAVEELEYDFISTDEVLLSDNPNVIYHESLTLLSYLSALTSRIKVLTGIMVLPKRSTIIVAKQAAELDILSNGRLRLGVGVGWNKSEFRALGVDFHTRGQLIEEQITLLQLLWKNSKVSYCGKFHELENIGINLTPIQQPIPIWVGGGADIVLRRAARMANGWIVDHELSGELFRQALGKIHAYRKEYGRKKSDFSIINYFRMNRLPESGWKNLIHDWEELGVTHVIVLPSWAQCEQSLDRYLEELRRFKLHMI